jgi:hypothetical protein
MILSDDDDVAEPDASAARWPDRGGGPAGEWSALT